MQEGALLVHLVTALGAALVGAAIALLLRQPLIVGYVLAGVAIGPFTPLPGGPRRARGRLDRPSFLGPTCANWLAR